VMCNWFALIVSSVRILCIIVGIEMRLFDLLCYDLGLGFHNMRVRVTLGLQLTTTITVEESGTATVESHYRSFHQCLCRLL
jgi:hypothetical protein